MYSKLLTLVLILSSVFSISAQSINSTTTIPSILNNSTSTLTLLPVPTYSSVSNSGNSSSTFSNSTASNLAKDLPGYTYNLTMESLSTRIGICNQTTLFCSISGCSTPTANVTTNFCNPNTMGWNCQCSSGATSRLIQQPLMVPVNSYDCKFRSSNCLSACQVPSADTDNNSSSNGGNGVIVKDITACQNACNYILTETCGTNEQVSAQYRVDSFDEVPKYYPDTSKGGVALGITTSGTSHVLSYHSNLVAAFSFLAGMIILEL